MCYTSMTFENRMNMPMERIRLSEELPSRLRLEGDDAFRGNIMVS